MKQNVVTLKPSKYRVTFTGIYNYCLRGLGYGEDQASYFANVARKSIEVPELKEAIDSGRLTVSKARRIVKVITPATQGLWIERAATLPQTELDREVRGVDPSFVVDRIRPINRDQFEMRLALSEKTKAKLDRVRDLMKAGNLEAVLDVALDAYLEKKDPLRRAERTRLRRVKPTTAKKTMPAQVRHQVNLRDRGKCQVCGESRFTELHHVKPQAWGGPHAVENLTTLCSAHHKMRH